ncbi:MAG: hypothetical protein Q9181_007910 [Wetmoreana brouardii]
MSARFAYTPLPSLEPLNDEHKVEQSRDILVNGKLRSGTSNLQAALSTSMDNATCINQDDLTERNSQVNAMSDIYGNTSEVIVRLGEEDPNTQETADLIQTIALAAKTRDEERNLVYQRTLGHWAFEDPEALDSRLWVVQEIALPRNTKTHWSPSAGTPTSDTPDTWERWTLGDSRFSQRREAIKLICGSVQLPWEELFEYSWLLHDTGISSGSLELSELVQDEHIAAVQMLRIMRSVCYGELTVSHAAMGYDAAHYVAAWSRAFGLRQVLLLPTYARPLALHRSEDKVYALLGMIGRVRTALGTTETPFIKADYSKSVEEVYYDASKLILENTQRLDLLMLSLDPPDRRYPSLPSWVIDYSVEGPVLLTFYGRYKENISHLNAARDHDLAGLSFSSDGRILVLQDLSLAWVTDIDETNKKWDADYSFEASATLVLECEETYINDQSRLEALWRTLITDQT